MDKYIHLSVRTNRHSFWVHLPARRPQAIPGWRSYIYTMPTTPRQVGMTSLPMLLTKAGGPKNSPLPPPSNASLVLLTQMPSLLHTACMYVGNTRFALLAESLPLYSSRSQKKKRPRKIHAANPSGHVRREEERYLSPTMRAGTGTPPFHGN